MAERPIFVPNPSGNILVSVKTVSFDWHPGFAIVQKQKSIRSLHEAARSHCLGENLLEISSKSPEGLGRNLSAFSLRFRVDDWPDCPVECAFQGSKMFLQGGPFTDLYEAEPIQAKKDHRLKESGDLTGFSWLGEEWPITPPTLFYDWLYINALNQNQRLAEELIFFEGFTDIEFNPKRSINCQAHSAALYVALSKSGQIDLALQSREEFEQVIGTGAQNIPVQGILL